MARGWHYNGLTTTYILLGVVEARCEELSDSEYPCMIIMVTIVSKCTLYYLSKPLSRVVLMVLR